MLKIAVSSLVDFSLFMLNKEAIRQEIGRILSMLKGISIRNEIKISFVETFDLKKPETSVATQTSINNVTKL